MTQFFDYIKAIYYKSKLNVEDLDTGTTIGITTQLAKDIDNLSSLKHLSHYLFLIDPQYYWYLLWFNIPKKVKIPYFAKQSKTIQKEEELLKEVQSFLHWSDREMLISKKLLTKVLIDKTKWEKEFGLR